MGNTVINGSGSLAVVGSEAKRSLRVDFTTGHSVDMVSAPLPQSVITVGLFSNQCCGAAAPAGAGVSQVVSVGSPSSTATPQRAPAC